MKRYVITKPKRLIFALVLLVASLAFLVDFLDKRWIS